MHVDSLHIDCAYRFIFDKALVNKQDLSTYIFRALSGIFYIWAGRSIMMNYIVLLYIIYVNYIVMSRVQKEAHRDNDGPVPKHACRRVYTVYYFEVYCSEGNLRHPCGVGGYR